MGYEYAYEFEEMINLGLLPTLFSAVPSFVVNIATYVLTALALYTIAKRRGLNNPWLAWIPVADAWLLGSISDQYRYVKKGEYKSKRKILLILSILSVVCGLVMAGMGIAAVVNVVTAAMHQLSEEQLMGQIMGPVMGLLGVCVPMIGISIAFAVIRFMALYDVYTSLDPRNSVMYLVLSIVFPVTLPFFLFFNRLKDEGMPPRRQPQQPVYEAPVYQEPREPWEQKDKDYL